MAPNPQQQPLAGPMTLQEYRQREKRVPDAKFTLHSNILYAKLNVTTTHCTATRILENLLVIL
jgi:hypothetical protein